MATTEEMDAMYRWTRYVYDLTRKYYLLGRDRLIDEIELQPGDRVLEIGCGTARNLIRLARKRPDIRCYGLDASNEMLATATAKVKARRLQDRITLRHESFSRRAFAEGAVRAAEWLAGRTGSYDFRDVFGQM